ncbi:MAG TPA: ABC transporter permease [Candidatus Limnocylindrales bacterium]|nr:ABC transporter permease [Candidatus Limnocylindrales bacterium]
MNALLTIARKDLKLLARNKAAFFWVLGFPIAMACFFGFVSSGAGGRGSLPIAVVDQDHTAYSKSLILRLRESEALRVRETPLDSATAAVRHGDLAAYVALRPGMSDNFGFGADSASGIEIGIDPRQRVAADMLRGLVSQAVFLGMRESFGKSGSGREMVARQLERIRADTTATPEQRARSETVLRSLQSFMTILDSVDVPVAGDSSAATPAASVGDDTGGGPRIHMVEVAEQDNGPRTAYEVTFPSAIAWALIGTCMSFVISIVYERLTGTFLRLRLAPVSRAQVLAGKALACFIACIGSTTVLLTMGAYLFHIRVTNPLALLAAIFAAAFCFTGLMMFIASLGRSPQSVSGAGWAVMLVMSMTGGGMIPLIAMPAWMQAVSNFSLVKWAILGVEGAVWRGFTWGEMAVPLAVLVAAGATGLALGAAALGRSET